MGIPGVGASAPALTSGKSWALAPEEVVLFHLFLICEIGSSYQIPGRRSGASPVLILPGAAFTTEEAEEGRKFSLDMVDPPLQYVVVRHVV